MTGGLLAEQKQISFKVEGVVQGVNFRYRLADSLRHVECETDRL